MGVVCHGLGFLPPRLFLARARALSSVPALVPGKADGRPPGRSAPVLQRSAPLAEPRAFADLLAPLRKTDWVVYTKRPFAGPEAVLAYLSRYTHRVAIANSRLTAFDGKGVIFKWKDNRAKGRARQKVMTLAASDFFRRFLLHVLPKRFHRIRHKACPGLDPGASLPMAPGPQTSRAPVSCLMSRRQMINPIPSATQTAQSPPNLVRAAVDP